MSVKRSTPPLYDSTTSIIFNKDQIGESSLLSKDLDIHHHDYDVQISPTGPQHCRNSSIDSTLTISPVHSSPIAQPPLPSTVSPIHDLNKLVPSNNDQSHRHLNLNVDCLINGTNGDGRNRSNSASARRRTQLSTFQVKVLLRVLEHTAFPTKDMRDELSSLLGITPKTIQIWFQNQRAKAKQRMRRNKALAMLPPNATGAIMESARHSVPRMFEDVVGLGEGTKAEADRPGNKRSLDDGPTKLYEDLTAPLYSPRHDFIGIWGDSKKDVLKLPLSPLRSPSTNSTPLPSFLRALPSHTSTCNNAAVTNTMPIQSIPLIQHGLVPCDQLPYLAMRNYQSKLIHDQSPSTTSSFLSAAWSSCPSPIADPLWLATPSGPTSSPLSPATQNDIQSIIQVALHEASHQIVKNQPFLQSNLEAPNAARTSPPRSRIGSKPFHLALKPMMAMDPNDLFTGLNLPGLSELTLPLFDGDYFTATAPLFPDSIGGGSESGVGEFGMRPADLNHILPSIL